MKLVYITAATDEAEKISKMLVKERLVACVNMFPIKSCFRWKGKIEKAEEIAIIAKTSDKKASAAICRVKELHSYEVPCVVAVDVKAGNKDFLKWIEEETK
ncbi:MAG: divalent-cation tolerance protein CutA [Candidatus Aenigmarchaeota archaeon]|nr:divalent-cation tolerance protein CutA [Candidatus Aenigmarchaeota archaeon]